MDERLKKSDSPEGNGEIIELQGVEKRYKMYGSVVSRLKAVLLPDTKPSFSEFIALRSLDLTIREGEVFGIIGLNGSGKTTLLKLIAGIVRPTFGQVTTREKVYPLINIAAGFNPEFTGLENIYFVSSINGFSKREIDQKTDMIIKFADIGEHIRHPVKTYSSGMFMRLSFAVATGFERRIILIDEALATGDERFQRKCFERIHQMRKGGTTIVLVSHSSSTVQGLCDRVLFLHRGENLFIGDAKTAVTIYQQFMFSDHDRSEKIIHLLRTGQYEDMFKNHARPGQEKEKSPLFDPGLIPESTTRYDFNKESGVKIGMPSIWDKDGNRVNVLQNGATYVFRFQARFHKSLNRIQFGMLIKTVIGHELGGAQTRGKNGPSRVKKGQTLRVDFSFKCMLNPGTYFTNCGVLSEGKYVERLIDSHAFKVQPTHGSVATGTVDFGIEPEIALVKNTSTFTEHRKNEVSAY